MSILTKALTAVFLVASIILGYFLYDSIKSSIEKEERIDRLEKRIVDKLVMIREAQTAYQTVNGSYTSDWDKLLSFIDSGSFYLVNRKETIITLDYGADSVSVELDTLGTVSVKDSIFSSRKYPNFNLARLPYVPVDEPGWENIKFMMWADEIEKGTVMVDVVEVWNPRPVDPRRDEKDDNIKRRPLRFGSRTSVTTSGNWE